MKAHLILGNQLFKDFPNKDSKDKKIILIESIKSSNKYRYHKLKLVFMFSSMSHYKKYLEDNGFVVTLDGADIFMIHKESAFYK